jgi:hypothetical protein
VRHWTLGEATAALPDVRVKVHRLRELVRSRPTANGQGARLDTEIASIVNELQADGIIVRDPERGLIGDMALPLPVDEFGQDSKIVGLTIKVHSARDLNAVRREATEIRVIREDDSQD